MSLNLIGARFFVRTIGGGTREKTESIECRSTDNVGNAYCTTNAPILDSSFSHFARFRFLLTERKYWPVGAAHTTPRRSERSAAIQRESPAALTSNETLRARITTGLPRFARNDARVNGHWRLSESGSVLDCICNLLLSRHTASPIPRHPALANA